MTSYPVSSAFSKYKSFDVNDAKNPVTETKSWEKAMLIIGIALVIIGIVTLICSATVASSPMVAVVGAIIFDVGWPCLLGSAVSMAVRSCSRKLKMKKSLKKMNAELIGSKIDTHPNPIENKKHVITTDAPAGKKSPFLKASENANNSRWENILFESAIDNDGPL